MIYSMPFLLCIERIDRQFNNVFSFLSFLSSVCCLFLGCCALWAKDREREREGEEEGEAGVETTVYGPLMVIVPRSR